jgi:hypothetical protein
MGLFTRKRPPVYTWDHDWEPHFVDCPVEKGATTFSWTHPDDYTSQLISFIFSSDMQGVKHSFLEWWNVRDGDRVIFNFGHRTRANTGVCTTCVAIAGYYGGSQYPDTKSLLPLPNHLYMTPGLTITFNQSGYVGTDELVSVYLYFRRWMIR